MLLKKMLLLVLFAFSFNTSYSAFMVKGKIVEAGKGEPISSATIKIENTVLGTVTNKKGEFQIKGLPQGSFNLNIGSIGFERLVKSVDAKDSNVIDLGVIELAESSYMSKELVVTATRSEKVYEDVPIKVSVISDKIFSQTSSVSLKDGLSFQPGLRVETDCQNCGFAQVRLNGLEGKYSQVLIDGKAIYSSLNGVYGLDQIPSNMIDRVEVIRGGGSSLYGGNAIAGVVNIITKTPTSNIFRVSANQSYIEHTPSTSIQLSGSIVNDDQDLGIFLFGNTINRDEWDANGDGFTEIGRLNVKSHGANFFYKPSYLSKVTFEYHSVYHEIRGGDSLDLPPHQANICESTKHNTTVFQAQYEQYLGSTNNKISIYGSGQVTKRNSYYGANEDINAYGTTDNYTIASGLQYSHIKEDFFGNHLIIAGFEYNLDNMDDLAPSYNRNIHQKVYTSGLYFQDDWCITDYLDLVFGARADKHNLIENVIISPRANLMLKPIEDLSLRLSYSTGYRAPQAFDEDLHITQVGGGGLVIELAEDLKPEYSKSYSASLDYLIKIGDFPLAFSIEYFDTKLSDVFIMEEDGTDNSGNIILMRKNGESATVRGGTFEMASEFKDFTFKAGYTLQSSKFNQMVQWSAGDEEAGIDAQYSDEILRTPSQYGYFTLNYSPLENLFLNLSGVYTGSMNVPHYAGGIDPSGNEIQRDVLKSSGAFFELNSKISYQILNAPRIEIGLGMQNILNQFQNDFDRGINRDAGYIYGPSRPRTTYLEISTQL